jgi:hypothetical protein
MCLEIVCRDESKLSAMAPGVKACSASSVRMARRVGSAMAWNTSLRDVIMQLFDCKYNAVKWLRNNFPYFFNHRQHSHASAMQ